MIDKVELHRLLDQHFSLDELSTLCFELGIDLDDLGGVGQTGKAREFIKLLARRKRLPELVTLLETKHPEVDLSTVMVEPKPPAEPEMPAGFTGRVRPAMGGCSIGHFRGGAATFGCLTVDRADPTQVYILSDTSAYPIANTSIRPGDPVLQPGPADSGRLPQDRIASLSRWTRPVDDPMAAGENVSGSLAQVTDLSLVSPEIRGRGPLKGVRPAAEGMTVYGVGRTSGLVSGTIQLTDATVELLWPAAQTIDPQSHIDDQGQIAILFGGLIACTPMIGAGDSGMVLLDQDNYAIGLGFAGSPLQSLFIPMDRVLDALEVDLITAAVWKKLTAKIAD